MDDVVQSALRYAHGFIPISGGTSHTTSPIRLGRSTPHLFLKGDGEDCAHVIWLIGHEETKMSGLEIERWSVDAGPGPHLLLHLNRTRNEGLPDTVGVQHQYRDDVALFLGRIVMEGWTPPAPTVAPISRGEHPDSANAWPLHQEVFVIKPRIDAQKWAHDRDLSTTLRPVLRRCKVLITTGQLIGPQDLKESFENVLLDPGIHAPLESIGPEHLMEWTPSLNEVEAGLQRGDERLREELVDILSIRRVMPAAIAGDEAARVLRWWRPDIETMVIEEAWALLPAWEVDAPEMQPSVLCGWSGVVLAT